MRLKLYSDGGARGNPGSAAIAYLAVNETGEILKSESRCIGTHTNNQAEYNALICALQFALSVKAEEVECYLDSELVAKQLNGKYKVKNPDLQDLWRNVQQLRTRFQKISFTNVPRTHPCISRADGLLNKALDEENEMGLPKRL